MLHIGRAERRADIVSRAPPPLSVRKRATCTCPFSEASSNGVTPVCTGGGSDDQVRSAAAAPRWSGTGAATHIAPRFCGCAALHQHPRDRQVA